MNLPLILPELHRSKKMCWRTEPTAEEHSPQTEKGYNLLSTSHLKMTEKICYDRKKKTSQ